MQACSSLHLPQLSGHDRPHLRQVPPLPLQHHPGQHQHPTDVQPDLQPDPAQCGIGRERGRDGFPGGEVDGAFAPLLPDARLAHRVVRGSPGAALLHVVDHAQGSEQLEETDEGKKKG